VAGQFMPVFDPRPVLAGFRVAVSHFVPAPLRHHDQRPGQYLLAGVLAADFVTHGRRPLLTLVDLRLDHQQRHHQHDHKAGDDQNFL